MKKAIRNTYHFIEAIFRTVFRFIDRVFIIPVTKLIILIAEKTSKNSKSFERWLTRKNTLTFISLILAIIFFLLVENKSLVLVETSGEVLYNQNVEAIYNAESYVIEGLPKEADVILIGRRSDLFLAKQLSTKNITVDLSTLGVGTHKVSLTYENSINSIEYKVDPSSANITIYPKVSESRSVNVDVLNEDKLNTKLSVANVEIDEKNIIIKGAEHVLSKVSSVKALVDVSNITDEAVGVTTLKDIPLVAYDNSGNVIDVEMVPSEVNATISIVSPNKEVPIKVVPVGNVEFGKAINSISSSVTKVTVYGDETVINNIEFIPIEVDVSGLSNDKEFNVLLNKPAGIRYISQTSSTVKVSLDAETTKEFDNILIEHIKLDTNYKVSALNVDARATTVIVKGTASVLEAIEASTIKPTIDLSGLGEGDHEVEVKVTGDEVKATYTSKIAKVKIRISKK